MTPTAPVSLQAFQAAFYEACFSPSQPNLPPKHPASHIFSQLPVTQLAQYQWMVYANHADTLESIYPYCTQLLQDDAWQSVVSDYLRACPPSQYHLYGASTAFPGFLAQQDALMAQWPFLYELAQYELLEATLLRWPEASGEATLALPNHYQPWTHRRPVLHSAGQLMTTHYALGEVVSSLQSATHSTQLDWTPFMTPGPMVAFWAYRDANQRCRFFKVGGVVQAFLEACVQAKPATTYYDLWVQLSQQFSLMWDDALEAQWVAMVSQLEALGIVSGSLITSPLVKGI
jgi:hypothetical protein